MAAERGIPGRSFALDRVLEEVEFQVNQLDECVQRTVARMTETEEQHLLPLIVNAQDANRKSCILAELKMLLLDQRQIDGCTSSRLRPHVMCR